MNEPARQYQQVLARSYQQVLARAYQEVLARSHGPDPTPSPTA